MVILESTVIVSPGLDPQTSVNSKDIVISPQTSLSARLYIPKLTNPPQKFPLLIYFHGGGFCFESSSSPKYHNHLNSLVSRANIVAVSVEYRRAPEHLLPVPYDDSWEAIKWVISQFSENGSESWIRDFVDPDRVFFAGDSAGGNIAHNMSIRVGSEKLGGFKLVGVVLVHPFFWSNDSTGSEPRLEKKNMDPREFVRIVFPSAKDGCDDPHINPEKDPNLSGLVCTKVLVYVVEKDFLREKGLGYVEILKKSGWSGDAEIMEAQGEEH
ncbi:LOW QUALITY PROTEIN: Alpha/beta hydrolase fold-3, partial [Dillenia turbinata]